MFKRLFFSVVLMLLGIAAFAQNVQILGTVRSSADGVGIPGASVAVRGTSIGAATDADGQFQLLVPAGRSLTVSAVGYGTKTIAVPQAQNGKANMNIVLQSTQKALDEVIVTVPYGRQKRESITGSVGGINAAKLATRPVTNVANALSGAAPGIQVSAENGQPGSSGAIRIRGFGSISASNSPLVVVDGIPYDGGLSNINPADIENVTLLKDASSSALYGARAANGVIMVTTKRGKGAEPQINFTVNQGFSNRGIPEYERQGPEQYVVSAWNAYRNSLIYGTTKATPDAATTKTNADFGRVIGYNPFSVTADKLVVDGKINPDAKLLYNDFDWLKPLLRTGVRGDYNMNVSASNGRSDYFVSLAYLDDKGYIKGSDFNRFTGRVNVNTQATPWLKTGLNISGNISHVNNVQADADNASAYVNPIFFSRNIGPIYPVHIYDAKGNLLLNNLGQPQYDYGQDPNQPYQRASGAFPGRHTVYERMLNQNYTDRSSASARGYVTFNLMPNLQFTSNIGTDIINGLTTNYTNRIVGDAAGSGSLEKLEGTTNSYTFNQLLTWNKDFDRHHIDALLGHENYNLKYNYLDANRTGQIVDGVNELSNFTTAASVTSYTDRYKTEGYFARLNYDYDNRYFLSGSVRTDGSSRFSSQSRWGTFYSIGGAWVISREDFLNDQRWLNTLKLKVSYGQVGNDNLSGYYKYQSFYDLGFNNATEPGILLTSLPTPDLKWESNGTLNAGVEFGMFANRLTGSIEFFNRQSSNLLFDVPQPLSTPVTTISKNIGTMYNRGFEINLSGDVVRNRNVTWNLGTNFTTYKNRITRMPDESPTIISGTKQYKVGHSIYDYYLRQWYGVDPADGSSLYYPKDGVTTDLRTVNGISLTTNPNNAKYDYNHTTAIPKFFGSLSSSLDFYRFNFSFLLNYSVGGKAYDSIYAALMSMGTIGGALHVDALNAWSPTNTATNVPRLDITGSSYNNAGSTRYLIDASYLSIRSVSLGYSINPEVLKFAKIRNARVYVSGENLALFSKRKGLNPSETYTGVGSNTYVPQRIFNVGLNFGF